jgi:predicted  nucleic acid-binding Zn-ribbon protein
MSEKPIDLNALREQMKKREEVAVPKEQKIAELRSKIEELENSSTVNNAAGEFMALTPEEQQEEADRVTRNRGLAPGSYTIEDRKKELEDRDVQPPILREVRLDQWKTELGKLLSDDVEK